MTTLVDQFGQPLRKQELTREQAEPNVMENRHILTGHPAQGLTPERLAQILRAAEEGDAEAYLEMAEEMEEKDLHYSGVLSTRKRQVSQLEISVKPASEDAEDEANAQLVKDFLDRDELADEFVDILDAVGKGYSATEILWETSERQWMPRQLKWRYPQWFEFDPYEGETLYLRATGGQREPLVPFKFIVHRHKAKSGADIRGGFARMVSWWYLFKNYTVKDWITFIEIYGQPLRVGKYHAGATEQEKRALLRALTSIGSDAAAMIPEGMMMEFIDGQTGQSGSNSGIYKTFCDYVDALTSKAILGQTLTTQVSGDGGSRALGDVHNEVREDLERSDARQLAAALNRDLVRPLVFLNRGEPKNGYPKIRIGRPEESDPKQLTDSLAQLVPLGLRVGQNEVRRKLGFEDPGDDDEVLQAQAQAPQPVPGFAKRQGRTQTARRTTTAARDEPERPREAAEALTDQLDQLAGDAQDRAVDRIRELFDQGNSLEEVRELLLERYADLGDQEDLADRLREAMVLSELVGRDDADGDAGGGEA